ncbi:MAG: hypothetical protein ACR2NU_01985 [Aeoliella sp.]
MFSPTPSPPLEIAPIMASLKVIYRAVIMVGTFAVAGLAYVAYGPELQELQPVVDRLKEAAVDLLDNQNDQSIETPVAGGSLTPFPEAANSLAPLGAPPLVDARIEPANLEVAETPVAVIARRLEQLGVTEYSLTPWGPGGGFYRFECSAPWGSSGNFSQQFDAVASDPETAARQVLEQVEKSRVES